MASADLQQPQKTVPFDVRVGIFDPQLCSTQMTHFKSDSSLLQRNITINGCALPFTNASAQHQLVLLPRHQLN
jgi:hypothetical protein